MKISQQKSNTCFGTNIKFVAPEDFKNIRKSFLLTSASKDFIYDFDILNNCKTSRQCYRVNSPKCCTTEIKTCVGINVTNLKKKTSSFFAHFYHSVKNLNKLKIIQPHINGDNAQIIGQRQDRYAFSSEIYDTILNYCDANNIPVTKMRGLKKGYEADLSYEGKTDTLFVCVSKINNKKKYVNNFEQLKYAFKEISLASCDNIQFLKEGSVHFDCNIFQKLYYMFLETLF